MKPIWLKVAECPIREHHYQAAVKHCLRTGKVDAGEAVDQLEAEFARRLGVPREWVLACQSCTAGMGMCFKFLRGYKGVVAPAITWPGSYCMAFEPEFYDVEPRGIMGGNQVVLVDLFGAEDVVALVETWKGVADRPTIILDAAHNVLAAGHGQLLKQKDLDAVVYSFGAVKQMSGIRGGLVVSRYVDYRWRAARHYGVLHNRLPELPTGGNFDMNDFSASLVLAQLEEWEDTESKARALLEHYQTNLGPVQGKGIKILERGSGHLFVIWSEHRDRIRDALRFEGIETSVHYKLPAWLNPFDYPRSREWANTVLTLPLHSRMGIAEVDRVCEVVVEQIGGAENRQAAGAA